MKRHWELEKADETDQTGKKHADPKFRSFPHIDTPFESLVLPMQHFGTTNNHCYHGAN
jgi:hypothetical protein